MFNINDNVIHKSAGACIVKNIIKQNFGNGDMNYYYLTPKFPSIANKSLEIYLPVDKEEMFLRKPLSKADVLALIRTFPNMETFWISDSKTRKQKFEEIYHSGKIMELCKLVKLLYVDETFFKKPLSVTDKGLLTKVKNNIFDEFAVSLSINPIEVEQYIQKYLK
ncbi:MAG: CarD family transcriptional regulator [Candidatus Caccosoma sp.]|nr:CarD family transcriptional regulator [Candidatus Caccosoma sp.]